MQLNNYESRIDLLVDWILESLPPNADVLDVGANDGSFCPELQRVAKVSRTYSGVDPDVDKIGRHPFLTERYASTLQEAPLTPNSFDCIVSVYVLEHVEDPIRFLQAAMRALRPGGMFYFITPNGRHFFPFVANTLSKLGIQEKVLHIIRPHALVDAYHYQTVYAMNSPRVLCELGQETGFDDLEFRYSERLEEISSYFFGPTKAFPWMWEQMVKVTGAESRLLNLMGRMRKII